MGNWTEDQGDYDDEILALGGRIYPILANNSIERMFKLTNFLSPSHQIIFISRWRGLGVENLRLILLNIA